MRIEYNLQEIPASVKNHVSRLVTPSINFTCLRKLLVQQNVQPQGNLVKK